MASRRVLREYGNMSGPSIFFVLHELRRHLEENQVGAWASCWASIGPGVSLEIMVLRATGSEKDK
jgi:predicted naringenin-chalcone synthase